MTEVRLNRDGSTCLFLGRNSFSKRKKFPFKGISVMYCLLWQCSQLQCLSLEFLGFYMYINSCQKSLKVNCPWWPAATGTDYFLVTVVVELYCTLFGVSAKRRSMARCGGRAIWRHIQTYRLSKFAHNTSLIFEGTFSFECALSGETPLAHYWSSLLFLFLSSNSFRILSFSRWAL